LTPKKFEKKIVQMTEIHHKKQLCFQCQNPRRFNTGVPNALEATKLIVSFGTQVTKPTSSYNMMLLEPL
jgi:hypothetical protein